MPEQTHPFASPNPENIERSQANNGSGDRAGNSNAGSLTIDPYTGRPRSSQNSANNPVR